MHGRVYRQPRKERSHDTREIHDRASAAASVMTRSINAKCAFSSIFRTLSQEISSQTTRPKRIRGTKIAISMSCTASAHTEKPRSKVETQIAKTTRDSVRYDGRAESDREWAQASCAEPGHDRSRKQCVRCEQRSQDNRGTGRKPNRNPTPVPNSSGSRVVSTECDDPVPCPAKQGKIDLQARAKHQQQLSQVGKEIRDRPVRSRSHPVREDRSRSR